MHKRNMLDVFLVPMFLLSVLTINVSKVNVATPQVSVQPSHFSVGQEGVPLPTSPFTINIIVQNVEDLYMWQVYLYYNSTILSTREDLVIIPPENIFNGKATKIGPLIESDSKGTYILFGAAHFPELVGVTGSGVLCQITFTGQATGTSWLNLGITTDGGDSTLLADSFTNVIPCEISNGEVTVIGIENPREKSEITINVNPSTVNVGSNVTINGTINPKRVGVRVTIYYIPVLVAGKPGNATVQTNELSRYEYNWTTEEAVKYKLYAYWPGDANYTEATSPAITVTVNKGWTHISLNVYPTKVHVGSNVIMNGTIDTPKPTLPYENVTISYKRVGGEWTSLATVYPSEDGVYTYTWPTNETGSYQLRARWLGDKNSNSALSVEQTVEVTGESIAYIYYIIAAIAIIAIATIIYVTKIRKR